MKRASSALITLLASAYCALATEPLPRSFAEGKPLAGPARIHNAHIRSFAVDPDGSLLICDERGKRICVVSSDNTLITEWKLPFAPQVIEDFGDDQIVVGGAGTIALLDRQGTIRKKAPITETMRPGPFARTKAYRESITSIGMNENYIFFAMRTPDRNYGIYRLTHELTDKKLIVSGLRGCCGQMDFDIEGPSIYLAANCNFRVIKYDENGKETQSIGKRGKEKDGFGGCCEPKNVRVAKDGTIFTSESANGAVKCFTSDGTFVDEVARANHIGGCVRVTIDLSPDEKTLYMLDTSANNIRTFHR